QAVVPFGVLARRWPRVDVEVIQVLLDDRLLSPADDGAIGLDLNGRMEHEARLLLKRHSSEEILAALVDRDRCVPVRGRNRHQETTAVGSHRLSTVGIRRLPRSRAIERMARIRRTYPSRARREIIAAGKRSARSSRRSRRGA